MKPIEIEIKFTKEGFKCANPQERKKLIKFCNQYAGHKGKLNIKAGVPCRITFDEGSNVEVTRYYPSDFTQ